MSERRHLPETRKSLTHKFSVAGHEGYITVGLYDDGSPGEVFITMYKGGSTLSGFINAVAVLTSMCLQHGVSLETLVAKFKHTSFEPQGYTINRDIPQASSILDYVFTWLESRFKEDRNDTQATNG